MTTKQQTINKPKKIIKKNKKEPKEEDYDIVKFVLDGENKEVKFKKQDIRPNSEGRISMSVDPKGYVNYNLLIYKDISLENRKRFKVDFMEMLEKGNLYEMKNIKHHIDDTLRNEKKIKLLEKRKQYDATYRYNQKLRNWLIKISYINTFRVCDLEYVNNKIDNDKDKAIEVIEKIEEIEKEINKFLSKDLSNKYLVYENDTTHKRREDIYKMKEKMNYDLDRMKETKIIIKDWLSTQ